jgi:hypothetical protein
MIYFRYPLDIHGWKTKPETEPDTKPETEPENRGWEIIPKPKSAGPETCGYPPRTQSAAILSPDVSRSSSGQARVIHAYLKDDLERVEHD